MRAPVSLSHLALVCFFAVASLLAGPAVAGPPSKVDAPPPVAAILPVDTTFALVGGGALHTVAARWRAVLEPMAALAGGDVDVWRRAVEQVGFALDDPAAWRARGVDPEAGVAVALDTRLLPDALGPRGVLLLRVVDRAALLAHLAARGWAVTVGPAGEDGVASVDWPGGGGLLGLRAGWTAVSVGRGAPSPAYRATFAAWLKAPVGEGGLDRASAAPLGGGDGWVYGQARLDLLASLLPQSPVAPVAKTLAGLRFAIDLDWRDGRIRLDLTPAGDAALRLLGPSPGPRRPLARFVEPQRVAIAVSLAPATLFDGLRAVMPAAFGGSMMINALEAELARLGVTKQRLQSAWNGQVVLVGDAAGTDTIGATILGVAERGAAVELAAALAESLARQANSAARADTVDGVAGHVVEMPGGTLRLVPFKDALLFGRSADVLAAIAHAKTPGALAAPVLGEGELVVIRGPRAAFAAHIDSKGRTAGAGPAGFWTERVPDPVRFAVRTAPGGLAVDGSEASLAASAFISILVVATLNQLAPAEAGAAP